MTLPWLADVLRAAGLVVIEHGRWQSHARPGSWAPQYGVVHATAAPRSQADSVQVAVVRDGRSDLAGPIANAVVDRLGRWHVVGAGRCNSTLVGTAGPFKGRGNTNALSTEACNDNAGEPWPAAQYESYVRGWAAWCRRLGWTADRLVGHKEHTPGHKTDPTFNMAKFRADVAAVLAGKDEDMPSAKEIAQAVWSYDPDSVKDPAGLVNPSWRHDAKTNPTVKPSYGLYDMWDRVHNLQAGQAEARLRDEAILRAVTGGVAAEQLLAEIRAVGSRLDDLSDLVRAAQSGELAADEVVRLIGERLAGAAPTARD